MQELTKLLCGTNHRRYESVWEGDSFIIAFHTPSQALRFCMDVQQELLSLPWPTELLQSTYAEEVCCTVTKRKELRSKPELNKLALNTDDGWDAKDGGRSSNGEASNGVLTAQDIADGVSQTTYVSRLFQSAGNPDEETDTVDGCHGGSWALRGYWQSMWQRCSPGAAGAVLAYRGLRVRLGLHAGVPDAAAITFNSVMQRYHYTGGCMAYIARHARF